MLNRLLDHRDHRAQPLANAFASISDGRKLRVRVKSKFATSGVGLLFPSRGTLNSTPTVSTALLQTGP
jgi:hypothetical protein